MCSVATQVQGSLDHPEASLAIRKFVCHIMLAVSVMPHQCDHDQQRYSYCLQLNCQPQTGRWWSRPSPARSRRPAAWQPISGIAYFAPFSCGFSEVPCCHLPILVLFSVLNMLKNARYPCSWAELTWRRMPPTNIVTSYKWAGYHVGTLRSAAYGLTKS